MIGTPRPRWLLAGGIALLGLWLAHGSAAEAWFFSFIIVSGFATGSLGLLMIGHLMSEEWLTPIRSEAEAAALTTPLLLALAVPLAPSLAALYPWADGSWVAMPPLRRAYFDPTFFQGRALAYLLIWLALAVWITRTPYLRRTSAIGLALLAITVTFAANDWVLSREPQWWSSFFGLSFAVSQLLAALAGAILISLLRPEHPSPVHMQSLERALLTLALLAFWVWFAHFLIVWLANLPNEAAWYLARSGPWLWPVLGIALSALVAAVVILAPPGFGRRTMIAGSVLLLVQHAAHMVWLLGPSARQPVLSSESIPVGLAIAALWAWWFAVALRARPTFAAERGQSHDP